MAEKTIIAWTDHTFNIAWGCAKISPGCANCYADDLNKRYGSDAVWGPGKDRRLFGDAHWKKPAKWNRAAEKAGKIARVFASSMCDNFEDHPTVASMLPRLWQTIKATPWLDWQLLTKRADRIAECLPPDWGDGYENVWLGVSIENADYAWRADELCKVPAALRFVSYEPALGPLADALDLTGIHWIIYGGESGAKHRPEDKQWARDMRDKCAAAGVAFFHKQSAARFTERGIELDGQIIREYPEAARRLPSHVGA